MKRSISIFLSALLAVMASAILAGCASAGSIDALTVDVTPGTQMQRGFVNDNVLHTSDGMEIRFSLYVPASYYGPESLQRAYRQLCSLYAAQGMSQAEIDQLVVLDLREQDYFSSHGFSDQHAGGQAFAHDADVMSWLFSHRNN